MLEAFKVKFIFLEQGYKNKLLEKKREIVLEAAKVVQEQQMKQCNHVDRNLKIRIEKCTDEAVKDVIQILYNKGLFDS